VAVSRYSRESGIFSRYCLTLAHPSQLSDYVVEHKVGRLVVTRLCLLPQVQTVRFVQLAMARVLEKVANRAVICADWRDIDVLSPEVAEEVIHMLAVTNAKILQSAILLEPQKATFNLQVERVIANAKNSSRKSFRDTRNMLDWLTEFLEPNELQCAKDFLATSPLANVRGQSAPR